MSKRRGGSVFFLFFYQNLRALRLYKKSPVGMNVKPFWIALMLFALAPAHAQIPDTDEAIFLQKIKNVQGETTAERTLSAARGFVGAPYRAGTLEGPGRERLRINLRAVDCWTLVETALAMALCDGAYADFEARLLQLRYREGRAEGYGSRIHYFGEWLLHAQALGVLADLTPALGGVPLDKPINYVSVNAGRYPEQARTPVEAAKIREAESRLSAAGLSYIPRSKVGGMQHLLRDGDIVAFTSTLEGLDVAHQGFVIWRDGEPRLLHASSAPAKRVLITRESIAEYLAGQPKMSGLMVGRIRD